MVEEDANLSETAMGSDGEQKASLHRDFEAGGFEKRKHNA